MKESAMTNKKRNVIFLWTVVFLTVAMFLGSQENPDKSFTEYRIGPSDLIEIKFLNEDKLTAQVRVSQQGRVTLAMIGEVDVSGLTASELEKKLVRLYEKYLQKPQAFVRVLEFRSQRVSVLGAVAKQGPYDLLGRQTLLWLISEAGGLNKDVGKEIIILRQLSDGQSERLSILIEDLIFKGDPKLNIALEPGDIVNIPADKEVLIYLSGEIKNPGALRVMKSSIPTLFQAIAQAGGFTDRAVEGGVIVKRKDEKGAEKNFTVNVKDIKKGKIKDFPLLENDVIIVPQTWF
jgi:polysaccharide export outer membrane protein